MNLVILVIFTLLFIIATAIYIAVEGSLLGGIVMITINIGALLMINFLWRDK